VVRSAPVLGKVKPQCGWCTLHSKTQPASLSRLEL
jgi:hypothetical protein